MHFTFGKDFYLQFRPIDEEGNPLIVSADAPSIRVYKDQPSLAQARAGTGSSQQGSEITSWSTTPDGNGKIIAIPAIDDPDPTGGINTWSYYVCVNFTLTASEQTQTRIVEIWLSRVLAHTDTVTTTNQDIKNIYPAISSYLTNDQIDRYIGSAVQEIKIDIEADGSKWAGIQKLHKFVLAVAFKTIELAARGQRQSQGDKWDSLASDFATRYERIKTKIIVPYDSDKDGIIDQPAKAVQRDYMITVR